MNEIKNLKPFPRFCCSIGYIPTSYKISMTYEEQLLWLCDFLENTVIPTVNQNGQAVEELQNLFIELKNYVDNYFENLDVQEEINNKLDEMVEDGTLENILLNYTNIQKIYNSFLDLMEDTNLLNNMKVKTLGYHYVNDGGNGEYYISSNPNLKGYKITSNIENLYIYLIPINNTINVEQFGAKGNGEDDDTVILQNAINFCSTNNILLSSTGKIYLITNTLNFNNHIDIDFKMGTIITNNAIKMLNFNNTTRDNQGFLKNIIIDMNNIATYGIYGENIHKKTLDNIEIRNVSNVANHIENGFEVIYQNSHFYGTSINSIGIESETSDCHYKDIIMIDIHTAIKGGSGHSFTRVHSWIWTPELANGSKFAHITGGGELFFDNCYSDTMQYGFYIEQNCWAKIFLNQHRHLWNDNFINETIINSFNINKLYFIFYNGNDGYDLSRQFKITNSSLSGFEPNRNIAYICNLDDLNSQICFDDHTRLWKWLDLNKRYIRKNINELSSEKVELVQAPNRLIYFLGKTTLTLRIKVIEQLFANNTITLLTLPENYRPLAINYYSIPFSNDNNFKINGHCFGWIDSDGTVKIRPTENIDVNSELLLQCDFITNRNV